MEEQEESLAASLCFIGSIWLERNKKRTFEEMKLSAQKLETTFLR